MRGIKKILGFLAVLILAGCFGVTVRASAHPAVSEERPLIGYPAKKSGSVTIYEDKDLTEKQRRVSYRKFTILKISGDVVYVRYTVSGKKREGWARSSVFLADDYAEKVQAYAISGLQLICSCNTDAAFCSIPESTGGYITGKSQKRYQVMFYRNKRYYLGWVTQDVYEDKIRQSMATTEQLLADGIYTVKNKKTGEEVLTYDDGSLSMAESAGSKTQMFRLKYQKNGTYLITTYDEKRYLTVDDDGKVTAGTEKSYWYFSRNGAYFTLKEKSTGNSLAVTGNDTLKTADLKESANYQWSFTRKMLSKTKDTVTVFSQYDPRWASAVYCNGAKVRTIATSGCGVMAYVNAIYALNGQFIDPRTLAQYANANGHYVYMAGTQESLYQAFAASYGSVYHFRWSGRTISMSVLKNHLLNGGTAVTNVPGHYIAIAGYRKSDNKFLVLDSAVTGKRPTTITGDWVSESTLRTGTMNCYYFHLFSAR